MEEKGTAQTAREVKTASIHRVRANRVAVDTACRGLRLGPSSGNALDNETGQDAHTVQQSLSQLLNEMEHQKARVGNWQMELNTFSKSLVVIGQGYSIVMRSRVYLEQTMLEHVFGQLRHHQRRVTGRKVASASLVLRGSVRLVAVVATRMKTFTVQEFAAVSTENWQDVRSELQQHHSKRLQQRRFRRDPDGYLAELG
jgi:hypothetical protein